MAAAFCILPRDPSARDDADRIFAAYLTTLIEVVAEEVPAVAAPAAPSMVEPLGVARSNAAANASMNDPDLPNKLGNTLAKLLWEESEHLFVNNTKEALAMISRDTPINLEMRYGERGYTPLISACRDILFNTEIIRQIGVKLVQKGAKINVRGTGYSKSSTPLNLSIINNQGTATKILDKILKTPEVIYLDPDEHSTPLIEFGLDATSPLMSAMIQTQNVYSTVQLKLQIIAQLLFAGTRVYPWYLPLFLVCSNKFGRNEQYINFSLKFIQWLLVKLPDAWQVEGPHGIKDAFEVSEKIPEIKRAIIEARFKNEIKEAIGKPIINTILVACKYELSDIAMGMIGKFLSQDIPEGASAEDLDKLEKARILSLGPVLKLCCKPSMIEIKRFIEGLFAQKGLPLPLPKDSCAIAGGQRRSRKNGKGRRKTRSRKF
jgi:hypothetical protein